jgi:hypothetical protein
MTTHDPARFVGKNMRVPSNKRLAVSAWPVSQIDRTG